MRVSTEEQTDGWSLEGQQQQIRDFAERNGYEIVEVYQDETSGSKERRPGFEKLLMDAHNHRFAAVIVLHTSRFFRNIVMARKYKELLREKLNIDVIFINQPQVDPSDPNSFILETFNEMFDEYYLHQLRFWTSLGKQTRAQNGMWNGTLPFGYTTDEGSGAPVPHPTNAEGLRLAFESYASGRYSDRQIAELLNQHGYRTSGNWGERPFTKDTVRPLLMNMFYLGYVKYKGEVYPGQHPALIDQALFDRCQEVRASKRSKRRALGQKRNVYMLSGIARCHQCGITLRSHKTQSKGGWLYYRHMPHDRGVTCPVPGKYVRADVLEPQWAEIVGRIYLPADWRERIEELVGSADERQAIQREQMALEEKLRRLKHLYRDLLIDEREYRVSRDQLQTRLAMLTAPDSPQVIQAGEYLENLGALWAAASRAEQRDITRLMLRAMYVDIEAQQIVRIEVQPAFKRLLKDICQGLGVEMA